MDVDNRTVRSMFERFDLFFVPLIEEMNEKLQFGGVGVDVELDEIAFRSVSDGEDTYWIRFFAGVQRGSSLVYLYKLPTRVTSSGKGGGGPLSIEELGPALKLGSNPLLHVGSVVHTDSAKAYRHLSEDEICQCWMLDDTLVSLDHLKLGHTNVRQTPAPGIC